MQAALARLPHRARLLRKPACSPAPSKFFDRQWDNYERQLDDHLDHPTVNKVVIDTTGLGLTDDQMDRLDDHIAGLPQEERDKIIRIRTEEAGGGLER